jgi:hypothetical protein
MEVGSKSLEAFPVTVPLHELDELVGRELVLVGRRPAHRAVRAPSDTELAADDLDHGRPRYAGLARNFRTGLARFV